MKNINCLIIILFVTFLLLACKKRLDDDILPPEVLDTGYYDRGNNRMSGSINNLNTLSIERFGHIWATHDDVGVEDSGIDGTSYVNEIDTIIYDEDSVVIDTIYKFDKIDEMTFYSDLSGLELKVRYFIRIYYIDIYGLKKYGQERIIYRCE